MTDDGQESQTRMYYMGSRSRWPHGKNTFEGDRVPYQPRVMYRDYAKVNVWPFLRLFMDTCF